MNGIRHECSLPVTYSNKSSLLKMIGKEPIISSGAGSTWGLSTGAFRINQGRPAFIAFVLVINATIPGRKHYS